MKMLSLSFLQKFVICPFTFCRKKKNEKSNEPDISPAISEMQDMSRDNNDGLAPVSREHIYAEVYDVPRGSGSDGYLQPVDRSSDGYLEPESKTEDGYLESVDRSNDDYVN